MLDGGYSFSDADFRGCGVVMVMAEFLLEVIGGCEVVCVSVGF